MKRIKVIGGGLAGVEASYKLLKAGYGVDLYEMRPNKMTPAHKTNQLAELVCSNSLKSEDPATSQGELKYEMNALDSIVLKAGQLAKVPAGGALAVDRNIFSEKIEEILLSFPNLQIIREECTSIDDYSVIATGPLTSDAMAEKITSFTGAEKLHFFDAVAPIVTLESVDMTKAFYSSRYGKGDADYLNCPMNKEEYESFTNALINAQTVVLHEFEKGDVFEGCMPVEVMAKRGFDALRFGPLRPVGIYDENGKRPYAVVQLRKEDNYEGLVNLVGFQTNLTFPEQKRVFGMIPALQNAEFVRYGVMHRNTYINSPDILTEYFNLRTNPTVFFAGQITGVEGYMESAMSGMMAGINMIRLLKDKPLVCPPETTVIGSLARYIAMEKGTFSPMHVSFQLLPELVNKPRNKADRKSAYAEVARNAIDKFKSMLEL